MCTRVKIYGRALELIMGPRHNINYTNIGVMNCNFDDTIITLERIQAKLNGLGFWNLSYHAVCRGDDEFIIYAETDDTELIDEYHIELSV